MIDINASNKALVEGPVHYNSQNILIEHSLWNNRKEKSSVNYNEDDGQVDINYFKNKAPNFYK